MDIDDAIRTVRAAATALEEAHEQVAAAQQTLQRDALRAVIDADGDEEVRELVRRLYWEMPDLPVKTLEAVIGPARRVRELAAPGPALGPCADCGTELHATSRTNLAQGQDTCHPCTRERKRVELERDRQRAQEQWRAQQEREQQRLAASLDAEQDEWAHGLPTEEWFDDLEPLRRGRRPVW